MGVVGRGKEEVFCSPPNLLVTIWSDLWVWLFSGDRCSRTADWLVLVRKHLRVWQGPALGHSTLNQRSLSQPGPCSVQGALS